MNDHETPHFIEQEAQQETERLVDKIYQESLAEHPEFQNISEGEVKDLIRSAAEEIKILEQSADRTLAVAALTPDIAEKLSAIWIFSGPGTYDSRPDPVQTYGQYPWTQGMDRARINYAAWLTRKIAEIKSGQEKQAKPKRQITDRIEQTKALIDAYGPALMYNGSTIANEAVADALDQPGGIMPESKVHIFENDFRKTIEQIKTFSLPADLHTAGNEIGLVSHAPHLMRIARMLNRHPVLPTDMNVRLFPIATPAGKSEEYATMEIKGLLYYVFLSKDHDATPEPYPHTVHGSEVAKEDKK